VIPYEMKKEDELWRATRTSARRFPGSASSCAIIWLTFGRGLPAALGRIRSRGPVDFDRRQPLPARRHGSSALGKSNRKKSLSSGSAGTTLGEFFKDQSGPGARHSVTLGLLAWVFGLLRRETEERHQAENATQRTESFLPFHH